MGESRPAAVTHPSGLGRLGTLGWIGLGDTAPLSNQVGRDRASARGEFWLTLCLAAAAPAPTARNWRRLEVEPRSVDSRFAEQAADREYPFGVWRTLSWLLGVREDWPVYTSWHNAAGIRNPNPHHYVLAHKRDAAWHEADAAARELTQTEARQWWKHIRRLADAS